MPSPLSGVCPILVDRFAAFIGATITSTPLVATPLQPLSPGKVFIPHWIAFWVALIAGLTAAVTTSHLVPALLGRLFFIEPERSSTSISTAVFAVGLKLNEPQVSPMPLSTTTPVPASWGVVRAPPAPVSGPPPPLLPRDPWSAGKPPGATLAHAGANSKTHRIVD